MLILFKMRANKSVILIINININLSRLLLKYNVNPDTLSKDGNTAIHLALSSLNMELVSALLTSNLKINIPNNDGLFPIHAAVKVGFIR